MTELNSPAAVADLTAEMVNALTGPQLVIVYNVCANLLGLDTVAKFSDRKAGAKRVMKVLGDAQVKLATSEPSTKKKTAAKKAGGAPKTESIAGTIKALIADGKSNDEIWSIVQPKFNMPDGHKHYPQWYRRQVAKG
jgi:hypothetical protein